MKIYLIQHLPREICIMHLPGLAAPGKRKLKYSLPDFFSLFMAICFPCSAPRVWGAFHLVLNFSPTFFQSSRSVGQVKYSPCNSSSAGLLSRPGGQIYRWWFGQPATDTVRKCTSILVPGVSALLSISIQLLRTS